MRRALIFAVVACGGPKPAPTPPPSATPAPRIAVAIDAAVSPPDVLPVVTSPPPPSPPSPDQWHEPPMPDQIIDVVASGDNVYALGEAGIWRSTDGGQTWSDSPAGPKQCFRPIALASDPKRDHLWVGFCVDREHAFTSDDRGSTWTEVPGTLHRFVLADDGHTLWGSDQELSLARSDDRGKTWRSLGRPAGCGGTPDFVSVATQRIWMECADDQLFVSTDRGKSWRAPPPDQLHATADPDDPKSAWRVAGKGCVLEHSRDGGATWPIAARQPLHNAECDQEDVFKLPVTVGDTSYVARGSSILISTDHGAHWDATDAATPDQLEHLVAASHTLFAVGNGSVWMRTPPKRVEVPAPPIPAARRLGPFDATAGWTQIAGLVSEKLLVSGATIIALGLDDLDPPWVSTDEGRTWTSLPGCGGAKTAIASRANPRRIWLSGCFASNGDPLPPLASRDGKTFAPVPTAAGIRVLAIDNDGALLGLEGSVSRKSRDDGQTWTMLGAADEDRTADRMFVAPPGLWAIGGTLGFATSRDHGRTWQPGPAFRDAEDWAGVQSDGTALYALSDLACGAEVSINGGRTFRKLFHHDAESIDGGDYHSSSCPDPYRVVAFTIAADGTPWFVVGDTLRAGTRDTSRKVPEEPVDLAVLPHVIAVATSTGMVVITKRP